MSLFLVETTLKEIGSKEQFTELVNQIQKESAVSVIEVQVAKNFERAYFIIESNVQNDAENALNNVGVQVDLVKEVRLIGKDLEEVKNSREEVNYLVEWELPAHLTMEKYLERKKKNSVKYEEVPEVKFSRTYVCEDMTKCLCFYDAPNEEAVKRAREAVEAPISSLTELAD